MSSIVERAAELLGEVEEGSAEHEQTNRSSPRLPLSDKLSPIERAVAENLERSGLLEEPRLAPQQEHRDRSTDVAQKSSGQHTGGGPAAFRSGRTLADLNEGRTSQTLKVDRAGLRRQGMVEPDGARTPIAECFRLIKSQVLMNVDEPKSALPSNLVMVTSALAGEGKTFCAVNLAISIALERDRSVLLVDGDVANPSIPRTFGLNARLGLMDALLDPGVDLEDCLCKTDIGKLTLLPAGRVHQHATELLASATMKKLVQEMAGRYRDRTIIFDSPPLLGASEAAVMARHMGQIVIVVEAGRTPKGALEAAVDRIESNKVTGLILNKGEDGRSGYVYSGGYA